MNYDELPKPELIKLLKKQRQTIRTLQARIGQNGSSNISGAKLESCVRQALRALDDTAALSRCSLLGHLADHDGQNVDGAQLQQMLTRTVARLKPVNPRRNRQQKLRYDILRLTYLAKKKPADVAKKLALSERQYYRELKGAVQWVAEQLFGSVG